jgi:3-(3-hydroxy-phenyl)propionate hydroxylase
MHYDIAIIGYGPSGAVAANLFGAKGYRILVVEPKKEIWDIPRAVHLDGQIQRVLHSMGLSNEMNNITDAMTGINFLNAKGKSIVSVDFKDNPKLNGYHEDVMFDQPKYETLLRKHANGLPNIDFKLGYHLSKLDTLESKNDLEITNNETNDKSLISSTYVIGADGADSFVRKSLDIQLKDYNYDEDWVVVDYMVDDRYVINRDRYQICDYKRPTTLLPITNNHVRWEFKINPGDNVNEITSDKNIRDFMEPHLWRLHPDIDKNSGVLSRASKYTFHGLMAEKFTSNNCFLIGDAAHQTPPFLGQGMCQGAKDAYNLCWKLTGVLENKYDKKILESYSKERKEINDFGIKAAIEQGNVIGTQNKYKAMARDAFLSLARIFPKLKGSLSFGYKWQFTNGLLDKDLYPNNINGRIIPHPDISLNHNGLLFDDIFENKFALAFFDINESLFNKIKDSQSLKIFDGNVHLFNKNNIFMSDKKLLNWKVQNKISAVIIRPDMHVYGCCDFEDIIFKVDKLTKKLHEDLYAKIS